MIVSLPVSYLLLARHDAAVPGLQLGALGLALKLVVLQILTVNVQGWLIARHWRWRAGEWYQLSIALLLAISMSAKLLAFTGGRAVGVPAAVSVGVSMLAFVLGTLLLIKSRASWFGLSREDMSQFLRPTSWLRLGQRGSTALGAIW